MPAGRPPKRRKRLASTQRTVYPTPPPDDDPPSTAHVKPSISRHLASLVEGNPDSPGEAIWEHLNNGLDSSPDASSPAKATEHMQYVLMGISGRGWGQLIYHSLAIEDGALLSRRLRDFTLVQQAIESLEDFAHKVVANAFELDPSGRTGMHTEARFVFRQVGQISFILHELICSRKQGLDHFATLYTSSSFDFQSGHVD
ncbi:hypothetical protein SCHPADRAFT_946422 [Schizopora paradoxa]|uniref:Uncharacterized protein n=1 Tax=Schizopora paradoxa TaxID=27342 RepID=A0A0H2RMI7_9AGAM|nr:hypothetical protein SCHPADRAFT_946422 [Schizopora paradoxa]